MRALLIVLDGAGVGGTPDAAKYGDEGANTLGHLFEQCAGLELPALFSMGLGEILCIGPRTAPTAGHGRMRPRSAGKDTTTCHWETAGVISHEAFATFERFPDTLVRMIETAAKVKFIVSDTGDSAAILNALGPEHMKTGNPVLAALPDSVMQIYAHEAVIPRARLYEIARVARRYCNAHRISRVIAQPFKGKAGHFIDAEGMRELPTIPPRTILNAISETGVHVGAIGEVATFFANSGVTRRHSAQSGEEALGIIERIWNYHHDGLIFATLCGAAVQGKLRDMQGFAGALQQFDQWLGKFLGHLDPDDLLIITGDHGCDPVFPANGYTREEVPLLVKYDNKLESLGIRPTFADVAATLGSYFHLRVPWRIGTPFFKFPRPGIHGRPW